MALHTAVYLKYFATPILYIGAILGFFAVRDFILACSHLMSQSYQRRSGYQQQQQDAILVNADALRCPICKELPRSSVVLNCGHSLCEDCLVHHKRLSLSRPLCPICRVTITSEVKNFAMNGVVNSFDEFSKTQRPASSAGRNTAFNEFSQMERPSSNASRYPAFENQEHRSQPVAHRPAPQRQEISWFDIALGTLAVVGAVKVVGAACDAMEESAKPNKKNKEFGRKY